MPKRKKSRYEELSEEENGNIDCAHCLMPLQVADVIERYNTNGSIVAEEVVYVHLGTGDIYCEDQATPFNVATPKK